nr:unnamed protein product [Digitaria exilis]
MAARRRRRDKPLVLLARQPGGGPWRRRSGGDLPRRRGHGSSGAQHDGDLGGAPDRRRRPSGGSPFPDELLEEIFVRLADADDLALASAACTSFRRVISARHFLRRVSRLVDPDGFHPVEPPHRSAPAARAFDRAADPTFSFLPEPRRWVLCDTRDGLVLLFRRRVSRADAFDDLVVCDPLHRRYVQLPPIPDDLVASVLQPGWQPKRQEFTAFLAPTNSEDDDKDREERSPFSVNSTMVESGCWTMTESRTSAVAFVFCSGNSEWRGTTYHSSKSLSFGLFGYDHGYHHSYAHGCFFWTDDFWMCFSLVLDVHEMKFSIIDLPPKLNSGLLGVHAIIVDAGEGMLVFVVCLRITTNIWIPVADVANDARLYISMQIQQRRIHLSPHRPHAAGLAMASATARSIAATTAAQPSLPDELPNDLLEDIFLRLDDPADLARAYASCFSFRRHFLRRYRSLHRPPVVGFLSVSSGNPTPVGDRHPTSRFHPAEPPHRSVPAAADFALAFLSDPGRWSVRDVRDGRVLLSRESAVSGDAFEDLLEKETEDEDLPLRVICNVATDKEIRTLVFSSVTGKWRAVVELPGKPPLLLQLLLLDRMKFAHVDVPRESSYRMHSVVEVGGGRIGLLILGTRMLFLFSKAWPPDNNGDDGVKDYWRYDDAIPLADRNWHLSGGDGEGYALLKGQPLSNLHFAMAESDRVETSHRTAGGEMAPAAVPTLPDEALEVIFLRLGGAADLARVSGACATFRRLVRGHLFLRRFHALHPPPVLGFLHNMAGSGAAAFLPAEPPHRSAPSARALLGAADLAFSFLPPPLDPPGYWTDRPWHWSVRDARDARVLLSRRVPTDNDFADRLLFWRTSPDDAFADLVVCDPLHRRYVQIPAIPEDLVPIQRCDGMKFQPFLAPACKDEEDPSFRVLYNVVSQDKVVTLDFSSLFTGEIDSEPAKFAPLLCMRLFLLGKSS